MFYEFLYNIIGITHSIHFHENKSLITCLVYMVDSKNLYYFHVNDLKLKISIKYFTKLKIKINKWHYGFVIQTSKLFLIWLIQLHPFTGWFLRQLQERVQVWAKKRAFNERLKGSAKRGSTICRNASWRHRRCWWDSGVGEQNVGVHEGCARAFRRRAICRTSQQSAPRKCIQHW